MSYMRFRTQSRPTRQRQYVWRCVRTAAYMALAFLLGYLAAYWYEPAMADYKPIEDAIHVWWIVAR